MAQPVAATLAQIEFAPICTVYLRYAQPPRLPQPIYALHTQPDNGHFGPWVFDRRQTNPNCAGVLSVVISGAGAHQALTACGLAALVAQQMIATFGLPAPAGSAVIPEKRATIVPRRGLVHPPPRVSADGLNLAGDAGSPFPSTLEGSVRAGLAAAQALCAACGFTRV
ncbi:MAG: hypothetical protein RMK97_03300 [Sutterellaceae bacterium]|nr:hypothetical protein [Burkholderiaceae bacterium]MCX7901610.1 hypothetical protein [Burkholderiaceae bacterium]MDW8429518.1 hypothetical protein [Sutterellaceae bacterium]